MPPLLIDVATAAAAITAIVAGITLAWRLIIKPVIWMPIANAFKKEQVDPAIEPISLQLHEIKSLIIHHLGPNGDTIPLRDKVLIIEQDIKHMKEQQEE